MNAKRPAKKAAAKRAPRKKASAAASAKNDDIPVPQAPRYVDQPHGGALLSGGKVGNRGGSGRPPSELRARLRDAMGDRIGVIEDIADGEAMVRTEIPVISVLRHVLCPKCGGDLKMAETDALLAMSITILGKTSPTPRDRLSAIDLAAKYGLGTKDEISIVSADVVERLERQAARFVTELPPEALAIVRAIVDDVWQ